jgi:Flp pilus assembly pilin Flp
MLLALVAVAAIGVWVGFAGKVRAALATATNSISQPLG